MTTYLPTLTFPSRVIVTNTPRKLFSIYLYLFIYIEKQIIIIISLLYIVYDNSYTEWFILDRR